LPTFYVKPRQLHYFAMLLPNKHECKTIEQSAIRGSSGNNGVGQVLGPLSMVKVVSELFPNVTKPKLFMCSNLSGSINAEYLVAFLGAVGTLR
jgi:hypothetical protein